MDGNEKRARSAHKGKRKTYTIVIILAAALLVLAFALIILFACNGEDEDSSVITSDRFNAESEIEKEVYAQASKLKGEILDVCADKAQVALFTKDLDNYNYDVNTVKLVNALTGEVYKETSVRNSRGEAIKESIYADFCDTCGLYIVTVTYYDDTETADVDESKIERYHFTAEAEPREVGLAINEFHECRSLGDVYAISIDDKISFFDEDMNLLSDYNGDFLRVKDLPYLSADSYMVSEEEGYFYFFSETEALIFDIDGKCTGKFALDHTKAQIISSFVLNSGDVLVQYVSYVERDVDEYDYATANQRYKLSSFVMDHKSGEKSEYDLDYVVRDLSAAYESEPTEAGFPLTLKEGQENQAYISKISNARLEKSVDYVILSNDLSVQYTFPAAMDNVIYDDAYAIDSERFVATALIGGSLHQKHIFGVDGRVIAAFPKGDVKITDSYIVTEKVIYDHNMSTVYNFSANGYALVGVCGDKVYLSYYNEATTKTEAYAFFAGQSEPVKVTNGIDLYLYSQGGSAVITDNYYILEDEDGWKTIYNVNDEVICKTDGNTSIEIIEGALLIRNTIDGEIRNYVALALAE